jgi:membrane-associated phospholipid phosphatase
MAPPSVQVAREPLSKRIPGGFVLEAAAVWGLYQAYRWARNAVAGSAREAFTHAKQIIDWQEQLGIYHERTIQKWFLPYRWFIGVCNVWYGTAHFVGPVVTLVALYHFDPGRYVRWRNTFLWMLALGLIGFWLYPLMPPRLLPSSFGFVDTRLTYFTVGKPVPHSQEGGNLFAAMPSLHIGWSTWAVFALWPLVRPWWGRLILVSYPVVMLFATVVTGNHYFLDAVGGWGALALGYALARWRDWWPWRLPGREAERKRLLPLVRRSSAR